MLDAELERFRRDHPRCGELHARARGSLFGGVPMPWMMLWAGGYPVAVAEAAGRTRMLTRRPKVLVYSYCYHGSVDEAFAVAEGSRTVSRAGNVGPPVDPAVTTIAIEFNDLDALEQALATHEIACVLAEPAMTNMGIVLPDPGYHGAPGPAENECFSSMIRSVPCLRVSSRSTEVFAEAVSSLAC